jgi:type IV fimbrial biogenesis protein FimT
MTNNLNSFTHRGFTLVELMIVLAVAAILLSLAVPGYRSFTANNRATTTANQFLTVINLARSEAVKRGIPVSLCARAQPRTNPETCAGSTDWGTGWLLFTDNSGTRGQFDAADTLLQVWDELESNPASLTGDTSSVQYQSTGAANSAASFTLIYPDCTGENKRTISIALTGRAAVKTSVCS